MKRRVFSSIFNFKRLFFIILLFTLTFSVICNTTNAQPATLKPSEEKLYIGPTAAGAPALNSTYKNQIEKLIQRTFYMEIGPGAYTTDYREGSYNIPIQNLRNKLNNEYIPLFDSDFTQIKTNSGKLELTELGTKIAIARLLLYRDFNKLKSELETLKTITQNGDEKDIYNDVIEKIENLMPLDINEEGVLEAGESVNGITGASGKEFRLSQDGTKLINKTETNSGTETGSKYAYDDIIEDILDAIDEKANDTNSQNNSDIVALKKIVSDSRKIYDDTIVKLEKDYQQSNANGLTQNQKIYIGRREALTSIQKYIDAFLADNNNLTKPNNEKIINAYTNAKSIVDEKLKAAVADISNAGITYDISTGYFNRNEKIGCQKESFGGILTDPNCSLVAYLINLLLEGLTNIINWFVDLAASLFDWVVHIGIFDFNTWVKSSYSYELWRQIILALVTSLLLPLIFYLIIRMLIDNDTSNIEKVLPKILFTALFVYFSFTIVGWIIDQSNILTIYIYRSMSENPSQGIAEGLKRLLHLVGDTSNPALTDATNIVSKGDWQTIPLHFLRLILSSIALMVIFQGAILMFARTITLLLAMIFSPLMLLPVGIHSMIDKYRDMVIKYFSNGVLMGPIFMFLLLLAQKVGAVASKMVGTITTEPNAVISGPALAMMIETVLVIVVLQLAITVAKNLSGELGVLLSQKVSAFTGGLALGGTGSALRNTVGRFAMKAQEKGWMKGKEGSARHKMMTKLYGNLGKSTFDVRGTKAFKAAAGTSLGKNIGLGELGAASHNTSKSRLDRKLYEASKYYDSLGEEGRKRYINNLRSSIPGSYNHSVADKLEGRNGKKYQRSLQDKLENDSAFNNKFTTANSQKDEGLREQEMSKVMDEHFKDLGKGEKHFSETINKPENTDLKKEYMKIMQEKDENKRTEKLQTFINDKFQKAKSVDTQQTSHPSTPPTITTTSPLSSPSTIAPNNIPNSQSDRNIGASPEGPSGPGKNSSSRYSDSPSPVRQEENSIPPMPSSKSLSQHRLKERLREKYGTSERMEDGKIVKRFDQQLLDNRRRDLKTTQRNIEREEENKYQDNVLREAKERDKKTNLVNSNTSSTSSSSTVDSQSIQINYPNNGAKIIDIDDKKANNVDEDNIRA